MHNTKVGVDLAEKVIQVCVFRKKSVNSNKEMSPKPLWIGWQTASP